MKKWSYTKEDDSLISKLSKDLNVSEDIAHLLIKREIFDFNSAKDFFRPNLKNTHSPFLMKDMDLAVDRIIQAKNTNENVLVYGDYDVDGVTSVSMMCLFLSSQQINYQFYCPDRYEEGYGVSKRGIDFALENSVDLIITLDCGIRDVENIAYAKSMGIDVIICDHHNPGKSNPNADAILNPKQKECNYPFKDLCGCGVGFKLILAYYQKNKLDLSKAYEYLDFVAVANLADIVPIIGENRIYTFHGILKLNENPSIGLFSLLKRLSKTKDISSSEVLFGIAPMINAAGRISHAGDAVKLLIEKELEQAEKYAETLFLLNNERKKIQNEIFEEALKQIDYNSYTTVVASSNWHKGVIGIVASKLIEKHYRPTIVFSESNGKMTGSARSISNFNIYEIISKCEDLCENFGGHKYAAGITIKKENYESFKNRFELLVSGNIDPELLKNKINIDLNLDLNCLDDKFYRIVKQFSPFGPGNPEPIFCSYDLKLKYPPRLVGESQTHVQFTIETNNRIIKGIGFNSASQLKELNGDRINLCYSLSENFWNNKRELQLIIKDFY